MVRTWVRKRLRDDWPLLVLSAACGVFAVGFATLAGHVMEGNLEALDRAVRQGTVDGRPAPLVQFFRAVSFIGRKESLVVLGLAAGWLLFPRTWSWPVLLVACAFVSAQLVDALKESFAVARPPFGALTSASRSFPSGHASGAAAILVFLSFVAARHHVHPWLIGAVAALMTLLVGVSRIYLDKHWASDVIGGWIVGAAFGAAFSALYEWIRRHQRARAPTSTVPSVDGRTDS